MTLLAGRYTLDVPLGDSDLGTVWNAHDDAGTKVVLVTLEEDAPESIQERFRAHAKALVKTRHASLVHAIAEGDENGVPYLVVERLEGVSLATRLTSGPPPTVARIVEIATALCEALAAAHAAGIAHGDIEPGNVLIVEEGGKEVPKLISFALNRASVRQELGVRMSLPSLGPVAYAAPEQARGDVMDSALADQASLAAMVYAALGGRPPHIARDVAALANAIGTEKAPLLTMARRELAPFASTIDRALSSDPTKRFADISSFGRALKTAATMARSIATSPVPLGARSAIGEPPAPSLPRGVAIPKPAVGIGARARIPGPSRLGVAALPKPSPTSTPQPAPSAPAPEGPAQSTQALEVGDRLPAMFGSPQPAPVFTSAAPVAVIAPPPELSPVRSTEELDVSDLQLLPSSPPGPPAPPDATPELDSAELHSLPPHVLPPHVAPPPPPPEPPHASEGAADHALPSVAAEAEKTDEAPVQFSPSMEKIVAAAAAAPESAPLPAAPLAEAKPKPPAPPAPKAPPKPPAPMTSALIDPALAPPDDDDDAALLERAGGRPVWMVPAALAAVALLALVSWMGYRATQSDEMPHDPPGHTLTVIAPPTVTTPPPVTTLPPATTTVPATTVVEPPPETAIVPPPPTPPLTTTSVPAPPVTVATVHAPPTTRVTTTSHRPPSTTSRPPTRPPPPTSRTTRPPPTTTTRPTVVSDPGF